MADFIVDEEEIDGNGQVVKYVLVLLFLCYLFGIHVKLFRSSLLNAHVLLCCRRKKVKRKPLRQAAGVSSSALQEAHDIFGDVEELLALRKQELERDAINSGELRGNRLEDEFEPFILAEKYMTPKDEQIKENDVPERIQVNTS